MTKAAETATAPLENYHIVGVRENWWQAAPGEPRKPGGCCSHCGTGIAIEVVIRSTVDPSEPERVIGTTCAERVGMDIAMVKAYNAERFAEQREMARLHRSAEWKAANYLPTEAYGEDGMAVLAHFEAARAEACVRAKLRRHPAPVTADEIIAELGHDDCCPLAVMAGYELATNGHAWRYGMERASEALAQWAPAPFLPPVTIERPALFDLDGNLVTTNLYTEGQYGPAWRTSQGFVNAFPKRLATMARKGYYEGKVLALAERNRRGNRYAPTNARYEFERVVAILDNGVQL